MNKFFGKGMRVRSTWPNGAPLCEFGLPVLHFGQASVQATPEHMRAVALMLLEAAGMTEALTKKHAPKGDITAITLTYYPLAGDALLQGLSHTIEKLLFEDWCAKRAAAAQAAACSKCDSKAGHAGQTQGVPA